MSNDLIMIFFIHTKSPYSKKCVLSQPQPWLSLGFILSLSAFPSNQRTTDGTLRFHVLQLLHFQLSLPMTPLTELAVQCISFDPAPEPSFSFPQTLLLLFPWKILQLLCFLPWTDSVFSMLPPSLLPALRVAIFRPRKLACVEPADYPQPLGNLCTMLSIPEARSRHTWPAWSYYGLGRIYLLGSSVPQVFSSWCSDTSAERLGTALTGCVASPGCFYFFGMSSLPRFCVCGTGGSSWARRTICVSSLPSPRAHNIDIFHVPSAHIPSL